jgi:glycosyltransferase involved in cell wall biosynthesis
VVLSIRAARPLYNLLIIAAAIPEVVARVPAARFVIRTYSVDNALLAEFRARVEASGVSGAVEYIGDLPDDHAIAELYRRAAVAVSVPSSDGTPQSVLEAMACGAVPVLSDLPWLREWVHDDQAALVVPVGDSEALARAIVRLLTEAPLRARLRATGLDVVRDHADSTLWMARNEAIYRRLAAAAPRPGRGDD